MIEQALISRLHGGKRWSTGAALSVAADVMLQQERFDELFCGLTHSVPLTRMRVAYAVAKVADKHPELVQPYVERLIDRLADPKNSYLARACMLQVVDKLELSSHEQETLVGLLRDFLFSESSIVKTLSLQLLAKFSVCDDALRAEVVPLLWHALDHGTAAMRVRARKLLKTYHLR